MVKLSFSNTNSSELGRLLVQRCGFLVDSPEDAMRALASGLVNAEGNHRDPEWYFSARQIDPRVTIIDRLPCDGVIEPKGQIYADGFVMSLRSGQSDGRLRFTKAHEICHTFFYELIPELKFCLHTTDPVEERLCNIGAEEILMPLARISAEAEHMPVSIESLEQLARRFGVSPSAMLVRLRQARLWHCELAYWHRMVDGSFVLDRKTGGRKADWKMDPSILQNVWDGREKEPASGIAFVYFERGDVSAAERVYYQAKRQGESVVTLWGRWKMTKHEKAPPLFRTAKRSKARPEHDVTRIGAQDAR